MSENFYIRRSEAAKYLKDNYGVGTTGTLAKLACIGGGPSFRKLGRFPLYTKEDLDNWANEKLDNGNFMFSKKDV